MTRILEVSDLSKSFGGLKALEAVNFDVNRGELLSIIGPNGSGKTTLFNLITGVYSVSGGKIFFNGNSIEKEKSNRIAEIGIGRTFQNLKLFHTLSVLENVLVALYCKRRPKTWAYIFGMRTGKEKEKELKERSLELIDFVGLKDKQNDVVRNLPYGDQKKTEIARALALSPDLLLLDEPVAGLNPIEKKEVIDLIQTIHRKRITVILIEHDMKVVMNISKRIIVLNFGKKIAEGSPEEIKRHNEVIEAYLGPDIEYE
jgi:branched-chain amino acid transport system ATP-binding protein